MKKIVSIWMCMYLLLFTGNVSSAAEAARLIRTYDSFEAQDTAVFGATMRKVEYSKEQAKNGNVSLKAIGEIGHGWAYVSFYNYCFEPGKTYSVKFDVYCVGGNVNLVQPVLNYTVNGKKKSINMRSYGLPRGNWVQYVHHVQIPYEKGEVSKNTLQINIKGFDDTYIDNLEVYEGVVPFTLPPYEEKEFNEFQSSEQYQSVYVSPSAQPDGDGSLEKPFASIEAARDYVRTINDDMTKDIHVNLMGGTYPLRETLRFTEEDSGTNGYYIHYRAYNNEEVLLSGGERITNWKESSIPGVYMATGVNAPNARNLYVNDKRAQRARYEDLVTPISWWDDEENTISQKDGLILPNGIIQNHAAATNIEIYKTVLFRCNWAVKGKAIANGDTTILSMAQPAFKTHEVANYSVLTWNATDEIRVENALEFLDTPGEWFLDIDTDILYYMPKDGENIHTAEIIIPKTEEMVTLFGSDLNNRVENIIFSGITFAHGANDYTSTRGRTGIQSTHVYSTDDTYGYQAGYRVVTGNIGLENAKNIQFRDNIIKHMSSVGINMLSGVENCEVSGNAMYDLSSAAVGAGDLNGAYVLDRRITPKNIRISNNIMADTANEYAQDPCIAVYYADGMQITNNEIFDTAYSPISVGWGWHNYKDSDICRNNNISYNRLYGYMRECLDGGGIYTLGNQPESRVAYNHVTADYRESQGLYHDEGSDYFTTEYNVLDVPQNSNQHWIHINTVPNNIVLNNNYVNIQDRSLKNGVTETNTRYDLYGGFSEEAVNSARKAGLEENYREKLRALIPQYEEQRGIRKVFLQTEEKGTQNPVQMRLGDVLTLRTLYERTNGEFYYRTDGTEYQSSDSSVVTVNGNQITATGNGIANIIGKTEEGFEVLISVSVGDEAVKFSLVTPKDRITVGEYVYLDPILKTKYQRYSSLPITYISSHPHVATVSDTGVIVGRMKGRTTITAKLDFNGKIIKDSLVIDVDDGKSAVNLGVRKHVYEVSQDKELLVSLTSGGQQKALDNKLMDIELTNVQIEETKEDISAYDEAMVYLYNNGVLQAGINPEDIITEDSYVTLLEKASRRNRVSFDAEDAETVPLTRERMAKFWADVIAYAWGESYAGRPQNDLMPDRAAISPELAGYVSAALEYEMVDVNLANPTFDPKREITYCEAADTIYRLLVPSAIRNFDYSETISDRTVDEREAMFRRTKQNRTKNNQTLTTVELKNAGSRAVPPEGIYAVNIKGVYRGIPAEGNDYVYVYDKNNLISDEKLLTKSYGEQSSGIVTEMHGKLQMISESGNVWDKEDSFTHAYKTLPDKTAYETIVTVNCIANTHMDAAAGIMLRADNTPSSVKIDYRIKTGGTTFLCWRAAEGEATQYVSLDKLNFPATLKLVRSDDNISAYYLQDGSWVHETTVKLSGLGKNTVIGPFLYSMTTETGAPCAALFDEYSIGDITVDGELPQVTEEETKLKESEPMEEAPQEEYVIDRDSCINLLNNGGFERGIDGWASNGTLSAGGLAAYAGKRGLIFSPSGTDGGYFTYRPGKLQRGKKYIMTFLAKTQDGSSNISANLQYHNGVKTDYADANWITGKTVNSDKWQRYIVEFTFPKSPSSNLLVINAGGKSALFVDDVELLEQ